MITSLQPTEKVIVSTLMYTTAETTPPTVTQEHQTCTESNLKMMSCTIIYEHNCLQEIPRTTIKSHTPRNPVPPLVCPRRHTDESTDTGRVTPTGHPPRSPRQDLLQRRSWEYVHNGVHGWPLPWRYGTRPEVPETVRRGVPPTSPTEEGVAEPRRGDDTAGVSHDGEVARLSP